MDIMVANAAGNFVVPAATMSPNAWKVSRDRPEWYILLRPGSVQRAIAYRRSVGRLIAIFHDSGARGLPGCAHAGAAKAA